MISKVKSKNFWRLGILIVAWAAIWWSIGFVPVPAQLTQPIQTTGSLIESGQHDQAAEGADYAEAVPFLQPEHLPSAIVSATLAAEDKRFWSHEGVDPLATLRAAGQWAWYRHPVSGASTITQQLVKLASPKDRTLWNKGIEALQAISLERKWSKERILAEYLNRAYYGDFCVGIAAASRHYFGKDPSQMTIAEAAFLAGIPQAPTRLNPRLSYKNTELRQKWILLRMRQLGYLNDESFQQALSTRVELVNPRRISETIQPRSKPGPS